MKTPLDTLFYPFEQNAIEWPKPDKSTIFFNAQFHNILRLFDKPSLYLQQYFKPYAKDLEKNGFHVSSELDVPSTLFDIALVALPKNHQESLFIIANALQHLKPEGIIICAAHNKEGGTRLVKMLQHFGLSGAQNISKNKAKVAWASKKHLDETALFSALKAGENQNILGGQFKSMPGLFGWDKIDSGSKILTQYLPHDLKGSGADFGCGYGFLSQHLLDHYPDIKDLICLDADRRAVSLCQENLKFSQKVQCRWEDLTKPVPHLSNLDFIVMNPPFHEGKKNDASIGLSFIETAALSLRPGGRLWMVSNVGLPYEHTLSTLYTHCKKEFEGNGFKVFCATR